MEFGSWKGMAIFIAPFICVIFVGLEVKSARAGTSDSRRRGARNRSGTSKHVCLFARSIVKSNPL
jgi:hypothetical protein